MSSSSDQRRMDLGPHDVGQIDVVTGRDGFSRSFFLRTISQHQIASRFVFPLYV
ncbi:hypothetical protein [Pontibacillus marinus]|uniref:hypothetical protein n=1 Tax=Pontibacillus marinus TaxID=273164 RepID=UPI0012E038BF|nr:hypothetical protein [Pontibacillus marinus]